MRLLLLLSIGCAIFYTIILLFKGDDIINELKPSKQQTEIKNDSRIRGVEIFNYYGVQYSIIVVDSTEYVCSSTGGMCKLK